MITSRHTEPPKKYCARRPNAAIPAKLHKNARNARSVRARCARLRRLYYSMHTSLPAVAGMAFGAVRDIARDDLSDDPCPVSEGVWFSQVLIWGF